MNIFQCGGHCLALRHSPTAGWDCDSFEFNKQDGTCRLGTFDGDVGQGVTIYRWIKSQSKTATFN